MHVSQVYRLSREGKIPTIRVGRYYRYDLEAIKAWERGAWTPDRDQAA